MCQIIIGHKDCQFYGVEGEKPSVCLLLTCPGLDGLQYIAIIMIANILA